MNIQVKLDCNLCTMVFKQFEAVSAVTNINSKSISLDLSRSAVIYYARNCKKHDPQYREQEETPVQVILNMLKGMHVTEEESLLLYKVIDSRVR